MASTEPATTTPAKANKTQNLNEIRSTLQTLVGQIKRVVKRITCSRMPDGSAQLVPACPPSSLQFGRQGPSGFAPPVPPVTPLPKFQFERDRCVLNVKNYVVKENLPHTSNSGHNVHKCNSFLEYNDGVIT